MEWQCQEFNSRPGPSLTAKLGSSFSCSQSFTDAQTTLSEPHPTSLQHPNTQTARRLTTGRKEDSVTPQHCGA